MGHATTADLSAGFDPENMAAWVMQFSPATDAEALKLLRSRFPDRPLSLRVAALDFLMRKASLRPAYSPR
ncbi:MAG: hypothetical protein P8Z80_13920 [Pseudolabrys sp.]